LAKTKVSFDAWGKRRNMDFSDSSNSASLAKITGNIGFTGHESISEIGLIHMNGRIYDPTIGRFLSADPLIQAPHNSQSYNRYSYVMNNPLSLVDPSGYGWLSKAWKKVRRIGSQVNSLRKSINKAALKAYRQIQTANPLSNALKRSKTLRRWGGYFAAAADLVGCSGACSAAYNAHVTAIMGGSMSDIGKGIAISYVTSQISQGVSEGIRPYIAGVAGKTVGKFVTAGVVGGTVARLSGGSFKNGAFAAVVMVGIKQSMSEPIKEGSAEWEAKEEQQLLEEIAPDQAMLATGEGLLASNWDWMNNHFTGETAKMCRTTCIDRYYGDLYDNAQIVAEQGLAGLAANQYAKYVQNHSPRIANRNTYGGKVQFETGVRQLKMIKQLQYITGFSAVAGAGAKGFVWGARAYCTVECF